MNENEIIDMNEDNDEEFFMNNAIELRDNAELDRVLKKASRNKYQVSYVIHYTIDLTRLNYLSYAQGQIKYDMCEKKFRELVQRAGANACIDRRTYVNAERIDTFMDSYLPRI
jgi:uncharacterized lipoprotein YehR (DUF1307 family)